MEPIINIVKLIERNPITRISSESFHSKLTVKIKENFTDSQQHLFLATFFCYLNYDIKSSFVVDLDEIWKWTGFSRKDPAKRLLEKCFTINIDYIVENFAPPTGGAGYEKVSDAETNDESRNLGGSGANKETILMTVNTFKKFCLKANTKRADEIHDYYIKLEELLHETVMEENDDIRNQLSLTHTRLYQKDKKISQLSKYVLRKFNNKFKAGNCVYFVRSPAIKDRFKVGSTANINTRLQDFSTSSPEPFEVIELFFTEFHTLLEKSIKEMFSKCRVSVNCEWYHNTEQDAIKQFILEQKKIYDKFKIYSDIETVDKLLHPSNDTLQDQDQVSEQVSECEESPSTSELSEFEEPQNEESLNDEAVAVYDNEKVCKTCHKNLPHRLFYCIDKSTRQYFDSCISCHQQENGGIEKKQCTRCLALKERSGFVLDKTKKDGLTYECKDCRYELNNQRIQKLKEDNPTFRKLPCSECKEYKFKKMFFLDTSVPVTEATTVYLSQCKDCFSRANGPHKQCFTCKGIKTTEEFDKKSANNDGLESYCKTCRKEDRDKIRNEQREQNKNKNKKQCLQCQEFLKSNMFFKNEQQELYDLCMNCYTPSSLQCNKCLEVKTKSCFSLDSTKKTGYRTLCKSCSWTRKKSSFTPHRIVSIPFSNF
jgi:hypothetical protein